MDHAYWGREFDQVAIRQAIDEVGIKAELVEDQDKLIEMTVSRLTRGKVIGWFQGRSEYGPRALGNRSILADPRDAGMKDLVNEKIKFREPFRPFAPSVLREDVGDGFDLDSDSPYMLMVAKVIPERQKPMSSAEEAGRRWAAIIGSMARRDRAFPTPIGERNNFDYSHRFPVTLTESTYWLGVEP